MARTHSTHSQHRTAVMASENVTSHFQHRLGSGAITDRNLSVRRWWDGCREWVRNRSQSPPVAPGRTDISSHSTVDCASNLWNVWNSITWRMLGPRRRGSGGNATRSGRTVPWSTRRRGNIAWPATRGRGVETKEHKITCSQLDSLKELPLQVDQKIGSSPRQDADAFSLHGFVDSQNGSGRRTASTSCGWISQERASGCGLACVLPLLEKRSLRRQVHVEDKGGIVDARNESSSP
jgi:hypothetical protein